MVRIPEPEPADHDERLGEAIEVYLALVEAGPPPEPEAFAARYPDLGDDLLAALEGLALVRGLVGDPGGHGPGSRLETGRRIAGYRIVRELGRGGMGVVYEAVHVGLDRPVALKVLGSQAAPDSSGRRRFLNEARTAAGLHHTHIVPVFDVGQVGGLCYYAMQRIEGSGLDRVIRHLRRDRATAAGPGSAGGTPLRSRLGLRVTPWSGLRGPSAPGAGSATGPWPSRAADPDPTRPAGDLSGPGGLAYAGAGPADRDDDSPFQPPRGSGYYRWVAEVGREAAEAVGHAHHLGVIHRDVKPSNLLVDGRGLVWVADFGLARRLADPSLTQQDSLLGTPRYMSPEQTRVGPIDGRSDLYSLGATLYELLTLRPPFEGQTAAELIEQIAHREPAAPRQFDPRVPRDLETIVLKLLSKRPADRYPASADLAEDLTRFLNYEPVRARRISPLGRALRFARRRPGITAVSTAAAAAILTVTTVAYVKILHERDQAIKAVQSQLWRESSVVRLSNVPNRRMTGLGLIRESAALKPDPALRAKLRNEAIEFLVMRDVEARPGFPTGRSRGLAFGPDGTRLAVLSQSQEDGETVSVWDVSGRSRLHDHTLRPAPPPPPPPAVVPDPAANRPPPAPPTAPGPGRGRGGVPGPLMAASGNVVAAVVLDAKGASQGLRIIEPGDRNEVRTLKLNTPGRNIRAVYATPDGRRLVTVEAVDLAPPRGGAGGGQAKAAPGRRRLYLVNLWDPEQVDAPVATLAQTDPEETAFTSPLVAVSPDGRSVATAWFHKTAVTLRDAEDGADLGLIETSSELTALALGPDSQLATAGSGEVRFWDTGSRTALPSLTPNQSEVRLLRFSPRGSLLAVVGRDGRGVELWDTSAHSVVAVLPTPDPVEDVAFSPDGRTLAASTTGKTTPVWAVLEPDVRVRIAGFDAVTRSLAYRADGLLAMGVWKGTIRYWKAGHCVQAGAPAEPPRDDGFNRERPASLAFDDRGRLVTLEPDALRVVSDPPRGPAGGDRVPLPRFPMFGRSGWSLTPSPGGRTLAASREGVVFLWRPAGPDKLVPVKPPAELARRVRDLNRDRGPGFGPGRSNGPPPLNWRAMAVAPGGDRLYLSEVGPVDGSGAAHAWALDGAQARSLDWPALPADATALALSPDGKTLAVGERTGAVRLIDTARGVLLARLPNESGEAESQVWSLAFSPDGRTLAVGPQQGPVVLWSPADPSAPILRLPGHRGSVASVAFDPKGRYLASAGTDKTVDVWDLGLIREEFTKLGLAW